VAWYGRAEVVPEVDAAAGAGVVGARVATGAGRRTILYAREGMEVLVRYGVEMGWCLEGRREGSEGKGKGRKVRVREGRGGKRRVRLTLSTHRTSAFALRVVQPAVNAMLVEGVCAYSCNYIPHASSAVHLQRTSLATISTSGKETLSHSTHLQDSSRRDTCSRRWDM